MIWTPPSPDIQAVMQHLNLHPDLDTCSHVFTRNNTVPAPSQRLYLGLPLVLHRSKKYYVVVKGRADSVTIDRLKPAYILH